MDKTKYEVYLDERKLLINAELEQARHFDKYILSLAAGVFGLSLAFIRQIAPEPEPGTIPFLIISWTAFGASILSTLISFLLSQEACSKQRKILAKWYQENTEHKEEELKSAFATWTKGLNWTSMFLFIVGVAFLIIFSTSNLLS